MGGTATVSTTDPLIGVMCLETPTPKDPRFSRNTADFKVLGDRAIFETIKGVWVEDILIGAEAHTPAFVDAAMSLKERGANLLVANCGYAISYQKAIATAAQLPTALASLVMLPQLDALLSPGKRIGLLTYDAEDLTDAHLRAAWPSLDHSRLAIGDVRGTEAWTDWRQRHPEYDYEVARRDVLSAATKLIESVPDVHFVLLECSMFPPFADEIRDLTRCPVFDILHLIDLVIDASVRTHAGRLPDVAQ